MPPTLNHTGVSNRSLNRGSCLKWKTSLKESKTEVSGIYLYCCWRITRWCSHSLWPLSLQLCLWHYIHTKSSAFNAHWLHGIHFWGKVLFWFLMGRISRRWKAANHAEAESPRLSKWWGCREWCSGGKLYYTSFSKTASAGSMEDSYRDLGLKCCDLLLELQRNSWENCWLSRNSEKFNSLCVFLEVLC